jgi:hypothetical protein
MAALLTISLTVLASAQPSNPPAQSPVVVYSIDPSSAAAGQQITITGWGFAASNTVRFDEISVPDVIIAWSVGINCPPGNSACHPGINQGLVVTVPSAAKAGQYDVSVENANGVSNVVTFTLIGTPLPPAR